MRYREICRRAPLRRALLGTCAGLTMFAPALADYPPGTVLTFTSDTTFTGQLATTGSLTFDTGRYTVIYMTPQTNPVPETFTGPGPFIKTGSGTLYIAGGQIDPTSGTVIDAGTLVLGYSITTPITPSIVGNIVDNGTFIVNADIQNRVAGDISGTGGLQITNYHTPPAGLTLTGNNTFTGDTLLNGNALQIGDGGSTGTLSSNVIGDGRTASLTFNRTGTYAYGGNISNLGLLVTGGGELIYTGTASAALSSDNSGAEIIASGSTLQIGNGGTTGSVTGMMGTNHGTLIFNRSDAYSESITLYGSGAVQITGGGTLSLTSSVNAGTVGIDSGSTLRLSNSAIYPAFFNVGSVVDNGAIQFALTQVGNPDSNGGLTINAAISGSGSVSQMGPIAITLSGPLSYTGGTTVSGGELILTGTRSVRGDFQISSGGTMVLAGASDYTSSAISLAAGGTLQIGNGAVSGTFNGSLNTAGTVAFNRSNSYTFSGSISGTGLLQQIGSGTTILTGTNTFTGGTAITAGVLQVGNGGTSGSIVGDVLDNGHFAFNRSDAYTFAGNVSGTGSLLQSGSGTTILTGANTYTGGTTISSGMLQIGDSGTSGSILGTVEDNAVLEFNRSDSYTFGGNVNGTGSLQQAGSGTTILAGTNTYSGGTLIASGTLQIGNNGTTGSIGGDVVDNGILAFGRSDSFEFSGAISGTGEIDQRGTGALILSGAHRYIGGLHIVSSGPVYLTSVDPYDGATITTTPGSTLYIGNAGTTGSLTGNFNLAGTLVFDRSDAYTFSGSISGAGAVGQNTSLLIVTGTNTYTGGTTIYGGRVLQIGNGGTTGSIAGNVATDGILAFDRSDTITFGGAISGAGQLKQTGTGTLILTGANTYTSGTTVGSGVLQIGNGGTTGSIQGDVYIPAGTVAFDRSDTYIFGGHIYGGGALQQIGSGTLVLDGPVSLTGPVSVSAGTLVIGDRSGLGDVQANVAVGAAGKLKGFGRITGNLGSAGTVMPGGSIGTLTVTGNYVQSSVGTLEIELSPAANSSLVVGGTASLAGTLKLDFDPSAYGTRSYPFLTASAVNGTFGNVVLNGLPSAEFYGVNYTATGVNLVTGPKQTGEFFGALTWDTLASARTFNDMVLTHNGSAYCTDPASNARRAKEADCPELSYWRQVWAGAAAIDGNDQHDAFSSRGIGLMGGVDWRSDDGFALGLAASYGKRALGGGGSRADTNSVSVALSGGLPLFAGKLDVDGFYSFENAETSRIFTPSNGAAQTAKAHPKSYVLGGAVQYSQPVIFKDLSALARLSYASIGQQSAAESGAAPFDLIQRKQSRAVFYGDFGGTFSHIFTLRSGAQLIPEVSLGVQADFGSAIKSTTLGLADATGPDFTVPPVGSRRTAFTGGFGVTTQKLGKYSLYLRANGRMTGSEREVIVLFGGAVGF